MQIKLIAEQTLRPRGGVGLYLYPVFNLVLRLGWVVNSTLRPLYPRRVGVGNTLPIVRPQGWSGWLRKTSPPPVFNLQTVHSVAIRYNV